jgi:hypothetical protein
MDMKIWIGVVVCLLIVCMVFPAFAAARPGAGEKGKSRSITLEQIIMRGQQYHDEGEYKSAVIIYGRAITGVEILADLNRISGEKQKKLLRQCYYKTACAQSMRGKKDKALKALKNAVAEGYKDIKEMEKDANLDNIRDTDGYREIVKKLRDNKKDDKSEDADKKSEKDTDKSKKPPEKSEEPAEESEKPAEKSGDEKAEPEPEDKDKKQQKKSENDKKSDSDKSTKKRWY